MSKCYFERQLADAAKRQEYCHKVIAKLTEENRELKAKVDFAYESAVDIICALRGEDLLKEMQDGI